MSHEKTKIRIKKKDAMWVAIGVVLLVLVCISLYSSFFQKKGNDSFAQCLAENNAVMYGTSWCSHCQNQKAAFGKSFQFVNYVDCDIQDWECEEAGVTGYPTWVINGEKYEGEQSLPKLASLAGCSIA